MNNKTGIRSGTSLRHSITTVPTYLHRLEPSPPGCMLYSDVPASSKASMIPCPCGASVSKGPSHLPHTLARTNNQIRPDRPAWTGPLIRPRRKCCPARSISPSFPPITAARAVVVLALLDPLRTSGGPSSFSSIHPSPLLLPPAGRLGRKSSQLGVASSKAPMV